MARATQCGGGGGGGTLGSLGFCDLATVLFDLCLFLFNMPTVLPGPSTARRERVPTWPLPAGRRNGDRYMIPDIPPNKEALGPVGTLLRRGG